MQNSMKPSAKYAQAATNLGAVASLTLAVFLAGCASKSAPPPAPAPPAAPPVAAKPAPPAAPSAVQPARPTGLPAVASWAEYRRRAARMIMASNQTGSFAGPLPDPLYGIAIISVQLNADGSIKLADMMRSSKVAPEVNQMALDAARRVGNFGSVANLPQPWSFNETFFYNDNRKFQLVTLVENR